MGLGQLQVACQIRYKPMWWAVCLKSLKGSFSQITTKFNLEPFLSYTCHKKKKSYSFVMCYSEGLLGPVKQIGLDAMKSEMIIVWIYKTKKYATVPIYPSHSPLCRGSPMACCTFFEFPMIQCHGIHASHCPALFGQQLESLKVSKSAPPSGCCQGNHEVQECKTEMFKLDKLMIESWDLKNW